MLSDSIGLDDVMRLAEASGGERVSIYVPTQPAGAATRENPIRYKNALREAEGMLVKLMPRAEEARRLLEPARAFEDDRGFWEAQGRGLAVFVDSEGLRMYRLPFDVKETVVVTHGFHIKPLLSTLAEDAAFFLLDISLNAVRLYRADSESVAEVDVPGLPSSLDSALWADKWQDQQQSHTTSAGVGQRGESVTHSSGDEGQDRQKEDIVRFFQMVDAALTPVLAEEKHPLVLACVPNLAPLYGEANSYANLLDESAAHDPEATRPEDIAARARPIVRSYLDRAMARDRESYGNLISSGRSTSAIDRVVAAAIEGRVDTLWVARDEEVWGRVDPVTNLISVHEHPEPGDEDLLDLAAVRALQAGGRIHSTDRAAVPDGALAAAILRY
jgi:hypothetical protein